MASRFRDRGRDLPAPLTRRRTRSLVVRQGGIHLSPRSWARRGAARMNHRGAWLTAAVLAVIVLLAQVAGASTRNESASLATSASISGELAGTTGAVTLSEQASATASEKSANGLETANEAFRAPPRQ